MSIRNLDNYSGEINDWMTRCFAFGTHIVTPENQAQYREKLLHQLENFKEEYRDVL